MRRSGSIVTFYSYKGGVGRSMALANVALLLARHGLKVLAVDWDLEAPGLERYFGHYFPQRDSGPGLLGLFMQAARKGIEELDYRLYCSTIDTETQHPISLLASGREQYGDYSRDLEHFHWDEFFGRHRGGEFVEQLRASWREEFDIVLIDSRTGLSDTGGICTIQLPDVVVAMFTANFQSLYGVRDVMRLAQRARQSLAYDRMPLTVLPLPARWGIQEFQETQVWLDRVVEGTQEFFEDWLPRPLTARDVIERLRLPQQDFFGFGERLAVVEQGTANPAGLGFIYERVATILEHDFADIGRALGIEPPPVPPPEPAARVRSTAATDDYHYDLFVSYERSSADWTIALVEALRRELEMLLQLPRIYLDITELRAGAHFLTAHASALARSRLMLAVLTPRYAAGEWTMREFHAFYERSKRSGRPLILPVLMRLGDFPVEIQSLQWIDLSDSTLPSAFTTSPRWAHHVMTLARRISDMISDAPPFDPDWERSLLAPMTSSRLSPWP
jgi:cellulose biosynthesis protein BcsQ